MLDLLWLLCAIKSCFKTYHRIQFSLTHGLLLFPKRKEKKKKKKKEEGRNGWQLSPRQTGGCPSPSSH
jgi:hypothetical protein